MLFFCFYFPFYPTAYVPVGSFLQVNSYPKFFCPAAHEHKRPPGGSSSSSGASIRRQLNLKFPLTGAATPPGLLATDSDRAIALHLWSVVPRPL